MDRIRQINITIAVHQVALTCNSLGSILSYRQGRYRYIKICQDLSNAVKRLDLAFPPFLYDAFYPDYCDALKKITGSLVDAQATAALLVHLQATAGDGYRSTVPAS